MNPPAELTPEQRHTALFAQMVMQLSSTGLVFLGRAPNPVTGKSETDLDLAQMVVDQLEMLESRTRGNLSPDEQKLLRQSLTTLRMTFVEAVREPSPKPADALPAEAPASSPPAPEAGEARKKFSKSYGQG